MLSARRASAFSRAIFPATMKASSVARTAMAVMAPASMTSMSVTPACVLFLLPVHMATPPVEGYRPD